MIENVTAINVVVQLISYDNATKTLRFATNTEATPSDAPSGAVVYLEIAFKNSSVK